MPQPVPVSAHNTRTRIGVVGAGSVGSSLAYAALIRGTAQEVALYDLAGDRVRAEGLDLAHGAMFTPASRVTASDDVAVLADSDVVFVTAGAKQKPGQTRMDLAGANAAVLETLMPRLVEQAPEAVFVLVTNPCDVLTVVAQRITGLPAGRVMASGTVLDTSRLRWLLAEEARVSTASVHATIVGEHGDTEFPLWSSANIGQIPLREWTVDGRRPFTEERLAEVADRTMNAAYTVIRGKGATNHAIGLAGARVAEAVLRDERTVLPVSTVLEDYRGISGVALSVPSVVARRGVVEQLLVPMDEREVALLRRSAEAIRGTLASIGR
ncbi:L-lactate dehydrogenase [Kocuria sp. M1R5S2]|uniref:L-lactate dehydrogenase n=1 Tax=Kocuria rhizosphaerae TaxID=3376285 RepID=UPI0037A4E37D